MRKCHYIHDKEAGKVWIPGCMGGTYGPEFCYCKRNEPTTYKGFEKQEYNRILTEKNEQIRELEKENAMLWRIIGKIRK